jgi:hypothetical protein
MQILTLVSPPSLTMPTTLLPVQRLDGRLASNILIPVWNGSALFAVFLYSDSTSSKVEARRGGAGRTSSAFGVADIVIVATYG